MGRRYSGFKMHRTDGNAAQRVTPSWNGGPMQVKSTIRPRLYLAGNPAMAPFTCGNTLREHIQRLPYTMVFKAEDT